MGNYCLGISTYIKARIGWQGLTTAEYLDYGDYYLITGTDIKNGLLDFSSCVFVSKERFNQDTHIQLRANDVLITKDGTIGKVAYVDSLPLPATLNSGVFLVRCDGSKILQKYFYYVLKSTLFKNFIEQTSAGSTIVHLYQKDIVKFSFTIPDSLKEQRYIVDVLESIDNLIDSLNSKITKKNNIFKGVLRAVFANNNNWKKTTLGAIAKIYQPQTITTNMMTEYGYDVYGANGVIGKYSKFNHKSWQNLIGCRGTCGIVNKTNNNVWINGNAMVINVDSNTSIDKEFLYFLLLSCDFSKCISGSSQPQIVRGSLIDYEISVPNSVFEQKQIVTILKSYENEIEICKKQIEKFNHIRDGLMNGILTGMIATLPKYKEE